MNLIGIASAAAGEMQNKRLQSLYQRDFVAWRADVLGFRSYEKMNEICTTALFGDVPRTAIKSSNGTSKSHEVANMVLWTGAVFDLNQTISIVSAPSLDQIEKSIFKYIKSAKARAAERGFIIPGIINEDLEWHRPGPEGKVFIAYGKKPPTGKEVNVFQGVRSEYGMTYVFFDEAGGLAKGMWTAAEAVLTGADARLIAIGNPDDVGTEWHKIFTEDKYAKDFNRFSISSYELPTFTGEKVYDHPDLGDKADPAMQERMLKALTQKEWVEHKKRIWGEKDARFKSKVEGEFPEEGGNNFFSTAVINKAYDTQIEYDESAPLILGVDIARWGLDESVIASNRGGRIRVEDTWSKCDTVDSARRIHKWAMEHGAVEIRIDSGGVGGPVYDMLDRLDEFANKSYRLVGFDNGMGSLDLKKWAQMRAYAHDSLRTQMAQGDIDLDYDDEELREQLNIVTFKFTIRGGIQITPKDELKSEMGGSPDRLDSVIMAACDMSPWIDNPWNHVPVGTVIATDREGVPDPGVTDYLSREGMPMIFKGFGQRRSW